MTISLTDTAYDMAHHRLTGLTDRSLLEDRMSHDKSRADRFGTGFAVLLISLNNLREVNTQLDHDAGNKALVAAAKTLTDSLRPTDTVARWSNEEFVVLVPDLLTMDAAAKVAEKLLASLSRKFSGTPSEIISFSFGVAVYPNDAINPTELFENARQAMLLARSHDKGHIQYASEPSGPMIWDK